MLAQLNQDLPFLVGYVAGVTGKAGLTPSVDVYGPTGSRIVVGAAATEWGAGLYAYTLPASLAVTPGVYAAVFSTADLTVYQQTQYSLRLVGVAGVEYLDASIAGIASALLGADPGGFGENTVGYALARIAVPGQYPAVISPINAAGYVAVVQGDDYLAANGRALIFTEPAPGAWPDLTGYQSLDLAVQPKAKYAAGRLPVAGTQIASANGLQRVQFELTTTDTTSMTVGERVYGFGVHAVLANASAATLALGAWTVLEGYR